MDGLSIALTNWDAAHFPKLPSNKPTEIREKVIRRGSSLPRRREKLNSGGRNSGKTQQKGKVFRDKKVMKLYWIV